MERQESTVFGLLSVRLFVTWLVYGSNGKMIKVWIDQDLCTGDGLCEEIVPDIFFGHSDGLFYVREAGTEVPDNPTHEMYQTVEVPENLVESTIEAAQECPGECIFLEVT